MERTSGCIQRLREDIYGSNETLSQIQTQIQNFVEYVSQADTLRGIHPRTRPCDFQQSLSRVEYQIQECRHFICVSSQQLSQSVSANLAHWATLEDQVSREIRQWRHERRRQVAVGGERSPPPNLQVWAEDLATLILDINQQLRKAKEYLSQSGDLQIDARFISVFTNQVEVCLSRLYNNCFDVEQQPQVIRTKTHFKPIVVSLLGVEVEVDVPAKVGPKVSVQVISEEQAQALPMLPGDPLVLVSNGEKHFKREGNWVKATLDKMQLHTNERRSSRGGTGTGLVHETKLCLYVKAEVRVAQFILQVSTISSPIVVITHGSQAALAHATVLWDWAFGELTRTPFQVPESAPWESVKDILKNTCFAVTECHLSDMNLACLANKWAASQSGDQVVRFEQFCKISLPQVQFSFWSWFYSALKNVGGSGPHQKKLHLHELFKGGLVVGFIDKEDAARILSQHVPGTFLLRFSDSVIGGMSIAYLNESGEVKHVNPLEMDFNKLAEKILQVDKYQDLIKKDGSGPVHKSDAFARFKTPSKPGYVPFQGGGEANIGYYDYDIDLDDILDHLGIDRDDNEMDVG